MASIKLAPSILAADFTRLGEQVREAQAAGADQIHIDVMDGRFTPNISMGLVVVEAVRRATTLPLDVHLMIVEPDHLLEGFAKAGANMLTVHWEACTHLHRTLQTIKGLGCKAGVAINPHTPALLLSEVLPLCDLVLVMSVNPGFGGQKFIPEMLPKVRQLQGMVNGLMRAEETAISIDGGINVETVKQVVDAGANMLVAGSAVFTEKHSVQAGMDALRAAITA